jgi:hypothetical protein
MILSPVGRPLRFSAVFMLFIFSYGCDCMQSADGIVLNRDTKTPVDGVMISSKEFLKNAITPGVEYSTTDGRFTFSKVDGGLQCPNLTLYFYKGGFKQKKMTFHPSTVDDTVYLESIFHP